MSGNGLRTDRPDRHRDILKDVRVGSAAAFPSQPAPSVRRARAIGRRSPPRRRSRASAPLQATPEEKAGALPRRGGRRRFRTCSCVRSAIRKMPKPTMSRKSARRSPLCWLKARGSDAEVGELGRLKSRTARLFDFVRITLVCSFAVCFHFREQLAAEAWIEAEKEGRVAERGDIGRNRTPKVSDLIKDPRKHFAANEAGRADPVSARRRIRQARPVWKSPTKTVVMQPLNYGTRGTSAPRLDRDGHAALCQKSCHAVTSRRPFPFKLRAMLQPHRRPAPPPPRRARRRSSSRRRRSTRRCACRRAGHWRAAAEAAVVSCGRRQPGRSAKLQPNDGAPDMAVTRPIPLRPDGSALASAERRSLIRAATAVALGSRRGASPERVIRNWDDDSRAARIFRARIEPGLDRRCHRASASIDPGAADAGTGLGVRPAPGNGYDARLERLDDDQAAVHRPRRPAARAFRGRRRAGQRRRSDDRRDDFRTDEKAADPERV